MNLEKKKKYCDININFNLFEIASPPVVLSFLTKAPFNLCCDSSEQYLAASIDVNYSDRISILKKIK